MGKQLLALAYGIVVSSGKLYNSRYEPIRSIAKKAFCSFSIAAGKITNLFIYLST